MDMDTGGILSTGAMIVAARAKISAATQRLSSRSMAERLSAVEALYEDVVAVPKTLRPVRARSLLGALSRAMGDHHALFGTALLASQRRRLSMVEIACKLREYLPAAALQQFLAIAIKKYPFEPAGKLARFCFAALWPDSPVWWTY